MLMTIGSTGSTGPTKVNRLWDALSERDDDALTCTACEDALPAYLAAPTGVADPALEAVARHLRSCAHCAALAAELQQLVQQATTATFPARPAAPRPDLTFLAAGEPLQPSSTPSHWWWIDAAGQLLIAFSAELLAAFTPPPLVGVKSAGGADLLHHLTLSAPDLAVAVNVQAATTTGQCTLWVDVNIPSTGGWPHLGGTAVRLWRDTELVAQQTTDAYGKVFFPAVARAELDALRLSIAPMSR